MVLSRWARFRSKIFFLSIHVENYEWIIIYSNTIIRMQFYSTICERYLNIYKTDYLVIIYVYKLRNFKTRISFKSYD